MPKVYAERFIVSNAEGSRSEIANKNLIFVDCEGHGPAPTLKGL